MSGVLPVASEKDKRIVVFTCEPTSGAARYVKEWGLSLASAGATVTLICPSNFDFRDELSSRGLAIVASSERQCFAAGRMERVARNLGQLWRNAGILLRTVRRGDVVHFQFTQRLIGITFFVLSYLRRCRIVLTAHDPRPHKWLLPEIFRRVEWRLTQWSYSLSDRIIVHNEAGRQVLITDFRQPTDKLVVIPHGPFKVENYAATPGPREDKLRVLLFGSIRENKGVYQAIEAVQLVNAGGDTRVLLTIAGEVFNAGEASYWQKCRGLIARDPEGITVIDRYVRDDEIGTLFGCNDVLLLPYNSYTSESGVAALALANRKAIIAARTGGLTALLDRGGCGIPIGECTPAGIGEAICKAIDAGPEALDVMGRAGAAMLEAERSWHTIARKTLQVYAGIA
ncbi:MAG: glycosyltransferase family 4 protein [Acidobacteriota bacterium]|nr:glycosyltransferase family 4 protein [Acidobacteriota bacterium]